MSIVDAFSQFTDLTKNRILALVDGSSADNLNRLVVILSTALALAVLLWPAQSSELPPLAQLQLSSSHVTILAEIP